MLRSRRTGLRAVPWTFIVALILVLPPGRAGAALPAAVATATTLYRADWHHGWSWRVAGGDLTTGGSPPDVDEPPYVLPADIHRFAVQTTIKVLSPSYKPGDARVVAAGFGLLVGQTPPTSGYYIGGTYGLFAGFIRFPCVSPCVRAICSTAGTDMPCGASGGGVLWQYALFGAHLRLDRGWHIYRVEVRGDRYRVLIDGRTMVRAVRIPGYETMRTLGLWSMYYRIRVRNFTVSTLPPAISHQAVEPETLVRRAVTWGDAGKPTLGPLFIDPAQYAYLHHESAATVRATGLVLTYGGDWGSSPTDTGSLPRHARGVFIVGDTVSQYRSPPEAMAAYQAMVEADQRAEESHEGYALLPTESVGDVSSASTYRDSYAGRSVTIDVLDARAGAYVFHIKLLALTDLVDSRGELDEMTYLGQLVVHRIETG